MRHKCDINATKMRQNVTKVRQKSKIVMRQKCAKILRQKCAKKRIMSHQFCLIRAYHLMNTYNIKPGFTPGFFLARGRLISPLPLYHTFLDMSNFSMHFDIFDTRVVYFWKKFILQKNFDNGKISHFIIPLSLPQKASEASPIWGGKTKNFRAITFRTYI